MKKFLIIFLFPFGLFAQEDLPVVKVNEEGEYTSKIAERKDKKIRSKDAIKKPGELNVLLADERIQVLDDYIKENPLTLTGFRIQLVFGNRNTVNKAKSQFYGNFNGTNLYESYLAPNFRLRVGDFITRLQADEFLNEVKSVFPNAYIVNDQINVPDYVKFD
ncbi:MAG: SPOR domain-containing protein [Bacteroidota bacterium]